MTQTEVDAAIWAEGFNPLPYQDSVGVWTIGIGYNMEAHGIPPEWVKPILDHTGITKDQAIEKLKKEWDSCASKAATIFGSDWSSFSDAQKFVVTDMIFNMGVGNRSRGFLSFRNTIEFMKIGNWRAVCNCLKSSKWYRQVGRRAERDIKILETNKIIKNI